MKITEIVDKNFPVSRIAKFLETAPVDELYSSVELSGRFNVPASTIRHSEALNKFKIKHGELNYYGSPKALEEFKKQVHE